MLDLIQQRKTGVKIVMAVVLGVICLAMVITLVPGLIPGTTNAGTNADSVARVGDQQISRLDVQNMLNRETRGQTLPPMLRGIYAKQVVDQMVFEKALELEADRMGIRVSPEMETDRIKKYLPMVFNGDTWVGKDRYTQEVQARTGMSVTEFEGFVRQQLVEEQVRGLLTDGITVSPEEVNDQFRRRNEKVAIDYALIKPSDLEPTINPSNEDLTAYFNKNRAQYQVPEKRSANYALLSADQLKKETAVTDKDLRAYYDQHIDRFKVENRVHVEHILCKTLGKTDAEVAEIKQKADDVLKKAKSGANFEDLAKKYSEDTTADKGGDLGWIVEGQTVPEFDHVAFSEPKGTISDLVKTQYGFHIIKVLDKEVAHTKTFEEVRSEIEPVVQEDAVRAKENEVYEQMAAAVRQSNRQPLADMAKKFNLETGTTQLASATEPLNGLGNSPDLHQVLFELRPGELSQPLRVERGIALVTLKDDQAAHQATLDEVRDTVLTNYRRENATTLAKTRAEELAKRVKAGEQLDKAAKAMGIEVKASEPFGRAGQVGDLGAASQFSGAFSMPVDTTSGATAIAGNWVVYRVTAHDEPKPEELILQKPQIEQQTLQAKQQAAFEAFRNALEDRLKREGKLVINDSALKALSGG